MPTVTRMVQVEIDSVELFEMFISVLSKHAQESTGKQRTLYSALGYLRADDVPSGQSDVDAVRIANGLFKDKQDHVTVDEFRKWLPCAIAIFGTEMLHRR